MIHSKSRLGPFKFTRGDIDVMSPCCLNINCTSLQNSGNMALRLVRTKFSRPPRARRKFQKSWRAFLGALINLWLFLMLDIFGSDTR